MYSSGLRYSVILVSRIRSPGAFHLPSSNGNFCSPGTERLCSGIESTREVAACNIKIRHTGRNNPLPMDPSNLTTLPTAAPPRLLNLQHHNVQHDTADCR